jgi:hypothetical protein
VNVPDWSRVTVTFPVVSVPVASSESVKAENVAPEIIADTAPMIMRLMRMLLFMYPSLR